MARKASGMMKEEEGKEGNERGGLKGEGEEIKVSGWKSMEETVRNSLVTQK